MLVTTTTHSSWQHKLDKCFMSKIRATQDGQWFYKGEQLVLVTILMVQHFISEMLAFSQQMPFINGEDQEDDVHTNRNDHDENLWKNIPR